METLQNLVFLGDATDLENFPVQFLVGIMKKIYLLEAAVERAFSRHKMIHTRLRANLEPESMDNQLFIRYDFETIY